MTSVYYFLFRLTILYTSHAGIVCVNRMVMHLSVVHPNTCLHFRGEDDRNISVCLCICDSKSYVFLNGKRNHYLQLLKLLNLRFNLCNYAIVCCFLYLIADWGTFLHKVKIEHFQLYNIFLKDISVLQQSTVIQ